MDGYGATIVVDLGFGDAGKGTIVDSLARQTSNPPTVVRFNGGAQAAHNVIAPDGRHHTFAQFGSGSFVPGARTHLSRFMLIDPSSMAAEAHHLSELGCGNVYARLTVDEQALVITPFMVAGNHLREVLRGDGRHGSCGLGIGETTAHSLTYPDEAVRAADLRDRPTLRRKLRAQQERKHDEFGVHFDGLFHHPDVGFDAVLLNDVTAPDVWAETLADLGRSFTIVDGVFLRRLSERSPLIFEGAQGVLIDEWYGFHPYTTWSTTTFANAMTLLQEIGYADSVTRLGVLRSYAVRHGPGPFPTWDDELTTRLTEPHNGTGRWQGAFRAGWFDAVLAKYAIDVCDGIDGLILTHLDRLPELQSPRLCTSYLLDIGMHNPTIDRLPRKRHLTDLTHQEWLTTEVLGRASPRYVTTGDDADAFIGAVEQRIGTRVTMCSYGPTASDKRWVNVPSF